MPRKNTNGGLCQSLMESAYEKFSAMRSHQGHLGRRWSAPGLTNRERLAVILGNMNYQVENGGLSQWVDNGYSREPGPNGVSVHVVIAGIADLFYDTDPEIAESLLGMMNLVETAPARNSGGLWSDDDEGHDDDPVGSHYEGGEKDYVAFIQKRRIAFLDAVVAQHPEADDPFQTDFSFYRASARMQATLARLGR